MCKPDGLDRISERRKPGDLRLFWYDDHPKQVRKFVRELNGLGYVAALYGDREDVFNDVRKAITASSEVPDVVVTDLKIDDAPIGVSGRDVGDTLIGMYKKEFSVPARIGVASHFPKLVAEAPEEVFCFRYLTSDLASGDRSLFREFLRQIEAAAITFWLDVWCVDYTAQNPIPYYGEQERYEVLRCSFGVVTEILGDSFLVWLWDPTRSQSRRLMRVPADRFRQLGLCEVQQPFRVVVYRDRQEHGAEIRVIKPLAQTGAFNVEPVLPSFDASAFRGY